MVSGEIIVVGGGAAGMMAAGRAAELGAKVHLLEKTRSLGNKLLISGKGRCNLTNAAQLRQFLANYPAGSKFLQGPLHRFSNDDLIGFFLDLGVETKVERGGRVFPLSERAEAIVEALAEYMRRNGVKVSYAAKAERVEVETSSYGRTTTKGVRLAEGTTLDAQCVIVATGGMSYPGTGSSGDGYRFARDCGHRVQELFPALVPLKISQPWVRDLMGLSLRNVTATLVVDGQPVQSEFGEMSFTHFGVSGPIILTLSRSAAVALRRKAQVSLRINLKPALDDQKIDLRLQRDFAKYSRKHFTNSLSDLLPKGLIPPIVELSAIPGDMPVNQITRAQRQRLAEIITNLELTVVDTLGLPAAIVTAGGVELDEVNPKTMESKLVDGLFFAGEVLDIDGVTGGFNLQAAFSTGRLAAESAVR